MGLELHPLILETPPYDFESAFGGAMSARAEAIFVLESAPIFRGRTQIAQHAIKNRVPTSFAFRDYVVAGGLFAYGVNFPAMYRRAADYLTEFYVARSRSISQWSCQPNSNWLSTSRPRRRSTSPFRRNCSRSPTR